MEKNIVFFGANLLWEDSEKKNNELMNIISMDFPFPFEDEIKDGCVPFLKSNGEKGIINVPQDLRA